MSGHLPDFSQFCPLHPVGHWQPLKRLQAPPFWHLQLSLQSGPYMSFWQSENSKPESNTAQCGTPNVFK